MFRGKLSVMGLTECGTELTGGALPQGDALAVRQILSRRCGALVPPLPIVVRRRSVPAVAVNRDRLVKPDLLYFTDSLWLLDALIADVISKARVRRS